MGTIVAIQPPHTRLAIPDLGEADRLFLWMIRTWVQGLNQSIEVDHEIEAGLLAHRIPEALTAFDGFMMSIATCARRNIDIQLRRSTAISTDEVILLRAFGAVGSGMRALSASVLSLLVDGTGRRIATDNLERLADHFAGAALVPTLFMKPERPTVGAGTWHGNTITGRLTAGSVPDVL
ncbi:MULTISPECIES: hypothetical protein [unclassified Minwuia]|jgi:hypothetical protein|uniref:hypothetical protein n=1 Tax=unclassified Minwuia TaxID=2618799 RepID=UPI00247942D0|nr:MULTISPECIES: hypothetical protein [unclassified Minwuia]